MTIRNDLLRHKILVQKYALNQANKFIKDLKLHLRPLVKSGFRSEELEQVLNDIVKRQFQQFEDFANYESRFYAKILSKYTKRKISAIEVDAVKISQMKLPLVRGESPDTFSDVFNRFKINKIQDIIQVVMDNQVLNKDYKQDLNNYFNGRLAIQSKSLIITSINCIAGNVRLLF